MGLGRALRGAVKFGQRDVVGRGTRSNVNKLKALAKTDVKDFFSKKGRRRIKHSMKRADVRAAATEKYGKKHKRDSEVGGLHYYADTERRRARRGRQAEARRRKADEAQHEARKRIENERSQRATSSEIAEFNRKMNADRTASYRRRERINNTRENIDKRRQRREDANYSKKFRAINPES